MATSTVAALDLVIERRVGFGSIADRLQAGAGAGAGRIRRVRELVLRRRAFGDGRA